MGTSIGSNMYFGMTSPSTPMTPWSTKDTPGYGKENEIIFLISSFLCMWKWFKSYYIIFFFSQWEA